MRHDLLREPLAARSWRELAYSLLGLPLAVLGLAVLLLPGLIVQFSAGILVVPMLPVYLTLALAVGLLQRLLARVLLGLEIPEPARPRRRPGLLGLLAYHLGDPASWRAVLQLLVRVPLGAAQFVLGFGWWAYGALLLAHPLLWWILPRSSPPTGWLWPLGSYGDRPWAQDMAVQSGGLLMLLAAPWLTRVPIAVDRLLLPPLLGPSAAARQHAHLVESREHAINQAAATLRRIERDLHDGPQARLIAHGMRLGQAESRLVRGDRETALQLLRESREETRAIVQELRELVLGIHPPALDSGLASALTILAARAPVLTTVQVELAHRPPAAVETILYFAVAELLANAGKHSGAGSAAVTVLSIGGNLRCLVTDDGRGGARTDGTGSGLRGLAERVRTMDGELTVDSPAGGPTTVTIDLPGSMSPTT
ncbi:sensor histidine kinase [Streptomyces sp. NPDC058439]|uniref:sensor histidine kinase n=1 Tax=Streptomyces sp. NPDC058439 TaxID=3346500 RepID=UPI0036697AD6